MSQRRTLDLVRGSVLIRFPFRDEDADALRDLCKSYGARWSPENKAWVINESKSNDLVNALRTRFDFEVL